MHSLLRPGGLLVLNVVARTASLLDDLVASVQRVFDACDGAIATSSSSSNSNSSNSSSTNSNSKSSSVGSAINGSCSSGSSSQVFLLRASDETVNVTLLTRKGIPTQSQSQPQQQQQSHQHHGRLLASWLAEVNLAHDPLRLEELLSKLQMQSPPT